MSTTVICQGLSGRDRDMRRDMASQRRPLYVVSVRGPRDWITYIKRHFFRSGDLVLLRAQAGNRTVPNLRSAPLSPRVHFLALSPYAACCLEYS